MQTPVTLFSALHALEHRFVLMELFLCDGDIDPDDVLPDDPAGTDVEVSGRDRITTASENVDKRIYATPN